MKTYRSPFSFLILFILVMLSAFAWGADVVPVVAPVAALSATPSASFLFWAKQNLTVILGLMLALSELLGSSPWLKGNGIIDSIIKCLKFMVTKDQTLN